LVHNIGALPILTEAERHANVFANPNFLDLSIEKMSGKLWEWGVGREEERGKRVS
jgi:hypothetical protein